jgi:hypothetical protein
MGRCTYQPRIESAHVSTARYMYHRGRDDEVVAVLQRALSGYEKDFWGDHPDTLLSMDGLGCVYWRRGRYGDAETLSLQSTTLEWFIGREDGTTMPKHSH